MSDINEVMLFGRLGRDAEIKSLPNGDLMATMRLATGEKWTDRNSGEKKERTEWHTVVVFGAQVETVEKYCRKGRRLIVRGPLRTRKWQAQDGSDRYSTEVVISGYIGRIDVVDFENTGGGADRSREESYGDVRGRGGREERGAGSSDGQSGGYGSGYGGGYGDGQSGGSSRNDMDDEIPF